MDFNVESWPIEKLLALYKEKKLNLNPPYQRNPIWSKGAQKSLIESIKSNAPLPTFFLLKKGKENYEMVDGQQRTRALILYNNTNELDEKGSLEPFKSTGFPKYPLNITIITSLSSGEHIEDYYAKINSSGLALNRPETFKARYFNTKFLELVEGIVKRNDFALLKLVPENSKKRMLDRDLVEELVALTIHNITDKKEQVEKMYESDLSKAEIDKATTLFNKAMDVVTEFNKIKPISTTRYRQRNDFYTLFGFITAHTNYDNATFKHFYNILLAVELGIKPDRTGCPPLYEYALNCITQSNSSVARERRLNRLVAK
ncbi:DUF262 domain-containing protein [Hymenobacter siberiensis]|uniref:DUF262 domain-containing protein n=1 Tax=Hymenobacter siberiensis TaxID=2848396 RepID=UPI001C1E3A6C|nr:DUF262 domain-containing protein [Hymenobacter siberiensis]MBU6122323.1 DUF262 domain-containing protein [Hymenobacter siberiensis]